MTRLLGIVLVGAGALLAWMGWQEKQTIRSRLEEVLRGSPSDRVLWMLGIGAVVVLIGLVLAVRGGRR
jgi:uncharacterized membrane protein YidH (DUF202 family)